jgi:hypothetical protein
VLWKGLGLPAPTKTPPWYGYSLGDWTETWEQFARNAVAGEWQKNGANTIKRRRGGLTPETPARLVENEGGAEAATAATIHAHDTTMPNLPDD